MVKSAGAQSARALSAWSSLLTLAGAHQSHHQIRREHARLLELLNNPGGAEREYRRALGLDPSDALTRISLARVLTVWDGADGTSANAHIRTTEHMNDGALGAPKALLPLQVTDMLSETQYENREKVF